MKRRTRVRLLAASPWLLAGGICTTVGHWVYGRDFRGVAE